MGEESQDPHRVKEGAGILEPLGGRDKLDAPQLGENGGFAEESKRLDDVVGKARGS